MQLTISRVFEYLQSNTVQYLTLEEAIGYVLTQLLEKDNYAYGLQLQLDTLWDSRFRVSDTILQDAVNWLNDQGFLRIYKQKTEGRGRPRHMMQVTASRKVEAKQLSELWLKRVGQR